MQTESDPILTRLLVDAAVRLVTDGVLRGDTDLQAAARGVVLLSRQYGRELPPEQGAQAWQTFTAIAAQARFDQAEAITAAILRQQRDGRPS